MRPKPITANVADDGRVTTGVCAATDHRPSRTERSSPSSAASRRERERDRVRRDLLDAVVRRVGDGDTAPRGCLDVDHVPADPEPADEAAVCGSRASTASRDRRPLDDQRVRVLRCGDHVVLASTVRPSDSKAGRYQEQLLDLARREVRVGDDDERCGHGARWLEERLVDPFRGRRDVHLHGSARASRDAGGDRVEQFRVARGVGLELVERERESSPREGSC